jgi:hypothetical protein
MAQRVGSDKARQGLPVRARKHGRLTTFAAGGCLPGLGNVPKKCANFPIYGFDITVLSFRRGAVVSAVASRRESQSPYAQGL